MQNQEIKVGDYVYTPSKCKEPVLVNGENVKDIELKILKQKEILIQMFKGRCKC